MLGETFGSYRITHAIAEGGMGAVFAAEHTLLGRPAAIKVLHPELSSRRDMVERFFNEARATTAIRHTGIVEVLDFGFDASGRAYIVMELLVGESLAGRARQGGVSVELAVSIVRRVTQAVGAAHQQGIVHRDLKPDNVFLVVDGDVAFGVRPKVLDFGIAKLARNDQVHARTQTGAVMGTPTYMSPEQCKGAGNVDHRADIYALGCILYELLAGRPPFVAEGFGEIIAAHITAAPTPVRAYAQVSPALDAAVMKCLAKSPDERFQSTHELVVALDAAMGAITHTPIPPAGWSASPGMPTTPMASAHTPMPSVPTTLGGAASESVSAPPRSRAPLITSVAVAVAAVAALVFVLTSGGGGGNGATTPTTPATQAPTTLTPPAPVEPPPVTAGTAPDAGTEAVAEVAKPDETKPDEAAKPDEKPKSARRKRKPRTTTTAQPTGGGLETDL